MSVALFDFDGTLTTRDTIWPFALFLSRAGRDRTSKRLRLAFSLLKLKFRLISNHSFKQEYAQTLLQGEDVARLESLARRFLQEQLEPILNRQVFQSLQQHVAAGDAVYLVSSNFDFFLQPLAEQWKLLGIFATQAEVAQGKFTGRITGLSCDGPEKLARAIACLGERQVRAAVAYGDSAGDEPLLRAVKTPIRIRKGNS